MEREGRRERRSTRRRGSSAAREGHACDMVGRPNLRLGPDLTGGFDTQAYATFWKSCSLADLSPTQGGTQRRILAGFSEDQSST
jgi:hypothetical protein